MIQKNNQIQIETCFPIEWFEDTYNEINKNTIYSLNDEIKRKINIAYVSNNSNYIEFINVVKSIININDEDLIKYYDKEKICMMCNKYYSKFEYEQKFLCVLCCENNENEFQFKQMQNDGLTI